MLHLAHAQDEWDRLGLRLQIQSSFFDGFPCHSGRKFL